MATKLELLKKIISNIERDINNKLELSLNSLDDGLCYSFMDSKIRNLYDVELYSLLITSSPDHFLFIYLLKSEDTKEIVQIKCDSIKDGFILFLTNYNNYKLCKECKTVKNICEEDVCTQCNIIAYMNSDIKHMCNICFDETWNYVTTKCCKNKYHRTCLLKVKVEYDDMYDKYIKCPTCRSKIIDL